MQILTEQNILKVDKDRADAAQFIVIVYQDGNISHIPRGFFRNNHDEDIINLNFGRFYIGRDSALGVGSIVKYDGNNQSLSIGRHVRGGLRLKFLLNGQHETRTMAMSMFSGLIRIPSPPQYGDTVLRNDIWIGDEAMVLGGVTIENGCVIGARTVLPPNFKSEPYGIYAGAPGRLIRYRFSEKVRQALVQLAWWEMPFSWIKDNNDYLLIDLAEDEYKSMDVLAELMEKKRHFTDASSP